MVTFVLAFQSHVLNPESVIFCAVKRLWFIIHYLFIIIYRIFFLFFASDNCSNVVAQLAKHLAFFSESDTIFI